MEVNRRFSSRAHRATCCFTMRPWSSS